jgi:hypothetical protein
MSLVWWCFDALARLSARAHETVERELPDDPLLRND